MPRVLRLRVGVLVVGLTDNLCRRAVATVVLSLLVGIFFPIGFLVFTTVVRDPMSAM